MKQIWGFDAKGPSGYTKHIALFEDTATNKREFRVTPGIAAPQIVIPLTPEAAAALKAVL